MPPGLLQTLRRGASHPKTLRMGKKPVGGIHVWANAEPKKEQNELASVVQTLASPPRQAAWSTPEATPPMMRLDPRGNGGLRS